MPPQQQTNVDELINILREVHSMLRSGGEVPPELKAVISDMLLKAKLFAAAPSPSSAADPSTPKSGDGDQKSKTPKKKKATKASKEKTLEVECIVCGELRTGRFVKRGFKCDSCIGTPEAAHARPAGTSAEHVPSFALPFGYKNHICANRHLGSAGDPEVSLTPPPPDITVTGGDDARAQQQHSLSFRRRGQVIAVPFVPPTVRYGLSVFNYAPETCADVGDEGLVDPQWVPQHRTTYYPTMLYNYHIVCDDATRRLLICHENADILRCAGVATGPPSRRNYDIIVQAALSALYLMQHLKEFHDTPHGDLRPYNFFIDAHHNVKIRVAPFVTWARLPVPWQAPEDAVGEAIKRSDSDASNLKKALYARDMYALGVTLTFFAYGTPQLPSDDASVEPGRERIMVKFLQSLCHPDAAERATIDVALHDPFFAMIRVVNGVPVESIYCRVDLAKPREVVGPAAGPSNALSPRDDTSPSTISGSGPSSRIHSFRRGSVAARMPPTPDHPDALFECVAASMGPGERLLDSFFGNTGPLFQVVRGTRSMTIYSVAMDPRRMADDAEVEPPLPSNYSLDAMSPESALLTNRTVSFGGVT